MSWDPNQQQGQQPSGPNPYSQPLSGSNPYANPYNPQQSTPNPYEQSAGQPGFGAPPTGFGAPNYGQPAPGMAYGYAPQAPRPWGEAVQALPGQYIKILTKPGKLSFAEEQSKATWGMIWTQLIFIGLIGTIVALISAAIGTAVTASLLGSGAGAAYGTVAGFFAGAGSVYDIVLVIVDFFIIVGIQFLLAKAFGGRGTFLQQGYNYLLFNTPLAVLSYVVALVPLLGGLVAFALSIYGIVLNVFSIQATHNMSGGKATWVVLIPYIALIVLVFLCVALFAALIVGALHGATATP